MSSKKRFSELSAYKKRRVATQQSSSSESSSSSTSHEDIPSFHNLSEEQQNEVALSEINQESSELMQNFPESASEHMTSHESSPISQDDSNISMHGQSPDVQSNVDIPQIDEQLNVSSSSNHDNENESDSDGDPYIFSDDDFLEDDDESQEDDAVEELRDFCIKNLKDDPTNRLLKILRDKFHLDNVPKNVNDLYKTPTMTTMPKPIEIEGGQYLHLGIKNNLQFVNNIHPNLTHLTLNFSWDGVRLFKSSNVNIWPIVMDVQELPDLDVMLVGVFIGNSKPKNSNEFFYCFNKEIMEIADNHYEVEVGVEKKRCTIHNEYMIADTPATTWALGMYYYC